MTCGMKKTILIWVVALTVLLSEQIVYATETQESTGLSCTVNEDGKSITLTRYDGSATGIRIPETITDNGIEYTVTAIGDECFKNNKDLLAVRIPKTVKVIGEGAFQECNSLQQVIFDGVGLEVIGKRAFFDCDLTSFSIPSTVKEVGDAAFGYASFEELTIPKSVTTWGSYVFSGTSEIKKVILEEGLTTVWDKMFDGCKNLEEVKLPSTIAVIGESAFSYCPQLNSLTLPKGLKSIEKDAFWYSTINTLIVEGNNYTVVEGAFSACTIGTLYCNKTSPIYQIYKARDFENIILTGVYLVEESVTVKSGKNVQLNIKNPVGEVTWTSDDPSIAMVSSTGLVTGYKKGTTTITAVNGDVVMTCKVKVKALEMSQYGAPMAVGCTLQLELEDAEEPITWESSNPNVASVNSKGLIIAKKKGKAVVIATYYGMTYTCDVTVKKNECKFAKYSTKASKHPKKKLTIRFKTMERDSKGNFKLTGHAINNLSGKVVTVKRMTVSVYRNGRRVAKQTFKKVKLNVGSRKAKKLNLTIKKKNVTKNANISSGDMSVVVKCSGISVK